MSYEDVIRIETPEGVDLELTLAGLGSRVAAGFLDLLIKFAINIVIALALTALGAMTGVSIQLLLLGIYLPVALFVEIAYDTAFETLGSGRTIGKRAGGLRVISATGAPVDLRSSAVRNIVRLVDGLLTGYLAGIVAVLATRRNQRLGDLAAGTIVVRERSGAERSQEIVYAFTHEEDRPPWDMSAVTGEDLATLRRFLERRATLEQGARERLARSLELRIRAKVVGVPDDLHPEALIEEVVRARSAR